MRHERKQTTRQEWGQFSEQIQDHINEQLDTLSLDIESANVLLAEYYEKDPEKAGEYAAEVIEYLDDRWGFMKDYFFVTGTWHMPEVAVGAEGVVSRHVKQQAFNTGRSNGFIVTPVDHGDDEVPRVGFSFIVGNPVNISTPAIQGMFEVLAFAEPHEVTLQYLRPGDSSVISSDLEEISDAVYRADKVLELYLQHHGSTFYRLSAQKQRQAILGIVESIEDALPSPDSLDRLLISVNSPFVYLTNHQGNRIVTVTAKQGSEIALQGRVLGVTTGGLMEHTGVPFRDVSDCGDAQIGLCFIVESDDMNFDVQGHEGGQVLVPMRYANSLELRLE